MWDFLNNLLEKAGFVAVVYAVTIAAAGLTIRALWLKLAEKETERAELTAKLAKAQAEQLAAVEAVRTSEGEKRARMREAFDEQIVALTDDRRREAAAFAEKLDQIQERRVQDAHAVVRESVQHIAEVSNSVDKITNAMTTLERVLRS